MLRVVSLATVGVWFLGCAEPSSLPRPWELDRAPESCPFSERARNVCRALGEVTLSRPDGRALAMQPVGCSVEEHAALVRWSIPELSPRPFEVAVRFRPPDLRDLAMAVQVEQVLYEWPCDERCLPELFVHVPTVATCGAGPMQRGLSVPLFPATVASCVGESWALGSDAHWCSEQPELGHTTYDVRTWTTRPPGSVEALRLDVSDDQTDARVESLPTAPFGERWRADLGPVRTTLETLWSRPTVTGHSCRDGELQLIEARRTDSWKVVVAHCRRLVELRQLKLVPDNNYFY